ncbi:peptidase [Haloferax volcanii]|uniref:peptidase n=1 Tax=Haloferax volcanii TaxID=2246 RepID=UPI00249C1B7F|nr:peptidase [Haloferax alexandrinus]
MAPVTFAGALVGVSLLGAGWSRLSAGRLERRDVSVQRFRQRVRSNWLYAAILFVGVVWWTNADRALLAAVGLQTDWPWAALGWALTGVGAAVVATVSYMGAFPVARRVRDADMGAGAAAAKMFRYQLFIAALVFCVVTVLHVEFRVLETSGLLTLLAFAAAAYAFSAPLVGVSQTTTVPDDATRERLDRLCDRAGLSVSRIRLLDGGGHRSDHLVRGPVGRKTLFLTDSLLDRYDDETVTALLAVDAGRVVRFVYGLRLFTVTAAGAFVFLGVAWSPFGFVLSFLTFAGVGVILLVTGEYASKRLVYRADEAAAERVGRAAVADALAATADEVDTGRAGSFLSFEPSLASRIERVRDGSGADETDA